MARQSPRSTFRILVNPASGGGKALHRVEPVARILRDTGAEVRVVHSLGIEHSVEEVALAAKNGEQMVACGGDGMLASVAAAVIDNGVSLGVIPSGRGNDFARQLRLLEASPQETAHTLLEGEASPVDVIRVADEDGHRVVLGSVYAGVDSLASELVNRAHWLPGSLQYPYAAVRSLLTYKPTRYTVTVDGSTVVVEAFSVVVANSGYYGKGMHIAPHATVDDGQLDVIVIPKASRLKLIRLMPKLYDGTHIEHEQVLSFRGASVQVSSKDRVAAFGDGEPLMDLPVSAEVLPGGLSVLLP
ncbi:MAG TPA: YegS/Rv2252/BmrU family lipid kinase [Nocardioidaceae bacterium]|nr:YegS/Rv2252/BmrU family lipid kinase [Nocardioidaceae bacterium]